MKSTPTKFPFSFSRPAFHWASSVALAALLAGCSGDDSIPAADDGGIDASGIDATGPGSDAGFDGSLNDAGSDVAAPDGGSDAANPDAGNPDAGNPDAGTDAGHHDGGNPDAGSDGGPIDAGSDAGDLDASEHDTGTSDAGSDATAVDAGSDANEVDATADASADAGEDAGSDGGAEASAPVTYSLDAQPIFQAKCAPCHTTLALGGVNFAAHYSDTQKAANAGIAACTGLTVGACTIVRIKNGSMPRGAGCTGNPTTDQGNASCLTQAQEDVIQAWVTDGQLP
jgi:hypothetical protein